ncbi:MAG: DUF2089 domain-containing protein [candidate division WOR-3 bacterium]|nr:DUF2089 domain-containing protein [candidate division WOR-3 bacterium]
MKDRIMSKCPKCGSKMFISELKCPDCATAVSGNFWIHKLLELPDDIINFMLVFLKNRGNIREVEKELGISYPTVRSRLDIMLALLGFESTQSKDEINEILDKLEKGEITAEQAERLIRER